MRLISVDKLTSDMILAKDIYHQDGRYLLRSGISNISKYKDLLQELGIGYLYIEDKVSEGIQIPDAIADETRSQCKVALYNTFNRIKKHCTVSLEGLSDSIELLITDILNKDDILLSLNDINAKDDYTLAHSVSTTVYSLLIAKRLNYSPSTMEKLAVGVLLHDLGKIYIDDEILLKQGKLTDEEYLKIKEHPILGYNVLKTNSSLAEESRLIAIAHHERVDGLGYPYGLTSSQLSEFSKISSIADVYDALTSDRCYRQKWSAKAAMDYLIEHSGTRFDTNLVSLFIQQIAVYPNGSTVRLSTGAIGIVESQNDNLPLRPIVRVVTDSEGKLIPYYSLDLVVDLSITIVESELERQAPPNDIL